MTVPESRLAELFRRHGRRVFRVCRSPEAPIVVPPARSSRVGGWISEAERREVDEAIQRPLTEADTRQIATRHWPQFDSHGKKMCPLDHQDWPCDASRLGEEVERLSRVASERLGRVDRFVRAFAEIEKQVQEARRLT